jgi:hypothetical protein
MGAKRFRAVFHGELMPRQDPELVKQRMAELYSTDRAEIEHLFQQVPVILKRDLSEERAEVLRSGLEFVGAVVSIEEDRGASREGSRRTETAVHEMEPPRTAMFRELGLVVCPRCGFEQPLSEACESCGIVFAKLDRPPERKHAGADGASSVEDVAAARAAVDRTAAEAAASVEPGPLPTAESSSWIWIASAAIGAGLAVVGLMVTASLVRADSASATTFAAALVLTPLACLGALWVGVRTALPPTAKGSVRLVGVAIAVAALLCLSAFAAVVIGGVS